MFGNLITNRQLKQLRKNNDVSIEPFNEQDLKSSHYTLHVGRILKHNADGVLVPAHSFRDHKSSTYELAGDEYVVVEAREQIKLLSNGIVGRFMAPSNLIESGLCLVAGQISNNYGTTGEGVRFGLKNMLRTPYIVDPTFRVAHLELFDMRGITVDAVPMTQEEKERWKRRLMRAVDDGVDYE
jgi:hypothetical protein